MLGVVKIVSYVILGAQALEMGVGEARVTSQLLLPHWDFGHVILIPSAKEENVEAPSSKGCMKWNEIMHRKHCTYCMLNKHLLLFY